jgi:hypothetical protein
MADYDYKRVPYHATELLPCNFCGSVAHMQQYTTDRAVTFVVMCSLIEGSPTGDDCPMVMPPDTFYAATRREAAAYWNEWAKFGRSRRGTSAQND